MRKGAQTNLQKLVREKSVKITDVAGQEVEVLEDSQAIVIADHCGCKMNDVYAEALGLGISPNRYIRNRSVISVKEQLRLAKSRVVVVGSGGLGGQNILLLARLGIGQLVVVDHDVFDETNLNRQALCSVSVLGQSKSEAAVAIVGQINPGVQISSHHVKLNSLNANEIMSGSDVVVDALDNVSDRFIVEAAAKQLGIPMVHGALAGFEGQLMTIFPDDTGLELLYGRKKKDVDKSKSPEAILGVPALTPSLVATLQAMEVLKIILKRGKVFRDIMVHVDLEAGRLNEFTFKK